MLIKIQSRTEPAVPAGIDSSHPLARGLAGCWLLNEGAGRIVHDVSGHSHHGMFFGNPAWSAWRFGRAIEFDGIDDWISMGDRLDMGTDDISVLAFLKYSAANQPDEWGGSRIGAIVGKGHLDGVGRGYGLVVSGTNQVHWQIRNQVASYYAISDIALNDGRWHLAIGVCDRDDAMGVRLYIDGALQSVTANATTLNGLALNGSRAFAIGSRQDEATGAWFWDFAGSIAMVCVWKRVLADVEICELQRNTFGMFTRGHPAIMCALPAVVVSCTGSVHAITSASASVRVSADAFGTIVVSTSVCGTLSTAVFVSPSATASSCSAVYGNLCIVAPRAVFKATIEMEIHWLREALFNGVTHAAFRLGTSLMQGWFWVRRDGCTAVYHGTDITHIDLSRILYIAEPNTEELSLPVYLSHAAGSTHCYLVRRFNSCGYQEKTIAAAAVFDITPNGQLAQARPNAVVGLKCEQTDAIVVWLAWFYCPLDQRILPSCFNLYSTGAAGEIDCERAIGSVKYEGQKVYCWHGNGFSDDEHGFVIRAISSSGIESTSSCGWTHQTVAPVPGSARILLARPV